MIYTALRFLVFALKLDADILIFRFQMLLLMFYSAKV